MGPVGHPNVACMPHGYKQGMEVMHGFGVICIMSIPVPHKQFLMTVHSPDPPRANPYASTASQQFNPLLPPGRLLTIPKILYAGAGSQGFSCNSLFLHRLPAIPTMPYTGEASQKF
ncbi:hypothetical protein O181_058988 [Austropuccinia psidii MF-1]|uniref:Uncharacterized protein n=1 Tax=Austropuccinia psidii MF-1 TaxID=1389203 RepID=A0A9Q3EE17_9BASI|nr:hypothetical protein [Austropuccinia psidii MF-1]